MSEPALASDGRVIGARAQRTRRRLLDATAELLAVRGAFEMRVVDITREVGMSPATFYQYFADVEAAILVLADEASDDAQFLADLLETSWLDADGETRALEFVRAFMDYWDRHRAILRVRDLRAEEGDKRFWSARLDGYAADRARAHRHDREGPGDGQRVERAQRVRRRFRAGGDDGAARHLPVGVRPAGCQQSNDGAMTSRRSRRPSVLRPA